MMNYHLIPFLVLMFFQILLSEAQLLEGIYCGKENCYDILEVTRETSKSDIAKNYRKLARKYHPDLHRGDQAKKEAEERFKIIATAYEILKDDEARTDYDYMLDNPNEYYAHYYRYYRRRVAPKVDVRIVVIVTISIISLIQHFSAKQRYESAIKYLMTVQKYRNKALEIAQEQGDEFNNVFNKKSKKKSSKAEQKEEQEKLIRKIIEEKMDIKGAYAKPELKDILWIQIIIFPYTLLDYIIWYVKWIWNFDILKKPYGREEKLYLIRKNMGLGIHKFNSLEDDQIEEYLADELWIKENFEKWKLEQEEEMKKNLADNARYKQYRRYMKNHGPGRITFDD